MGEFDYGAIVRASGLHELPGGQRVMLPPPERERDAGDPAGVARGEEGDGGSDVVGAAHAERMARFDFGPDLGRQMRHVLVDHWRVHESRRHGHDTDAFGASSQASDCVKPISPALLAL